MVADKEPPHATGRASKHERPGAGLDGHDSMGDTERHPMNASSPTTPIMSSSRSMAGAPGVDRSLQIGVRASKYDGDERPRVIVEVEPWVRAGDVMDVETAETIPDQPPSVEKWAAVVIQRQPPQQSRETRETRLVVALGAHHAIQPWICSDETSSPDACLCPPPPNASAISATSGPSGVERRPTWTRPSGSRIT